MTNDSPGEDFRSIEARRNKGEAERVQEGQGRQGLEKEIEGNEAWKGRYTEGSDPRRQIGETKEWMEIETDRHT